MCNENRNCKCISDILKIIVILQNNAERRESGLDTCDKKVLGGGCDCCGCNTRPIQLFLCGQNGNDPFVMPVTKGPITECTKFSDVFRVEKVDDCCATCRVLKLAKHEELRDDSCVEFVATNSFFTVDLQCVCCIKCLDDTFVENV